MIAAREVGQKRTRTDPFERQFQFGGRSKKKETSRLLGSVVREAHPPTGGVVGGEDGRVNLSLEFRETDSLLSAGIGEAATGGFGGWINSKAAQTGTSSANRMGKGAGTPSSFRGRIGKRRRLLLDSVVALDKGQQAPS
ncbi:hypothetical protein Droror1_Dr00009559 [Drosera rotundifolia]